MPGDHRGRRARGPGPREVSAGSGAPAWSIVVPTFNRPEALARCVTALAALHPPAGGFEIIVVNDGGVEPPDAVRDVAFFGGAAAASFLTQRNAGPAAARNQGVERARGKWLAFTDDDCVPEPEWLLMLERALSVTPDALVGGRVRNAIRSNLFAEASQQLSEYTREFFDGAGGRERFFTTNNIALSRAAFRGAGGFSGSFRRSAEDREFCDRWHAQGRTAVFEPRAVVDHAHDLNIASFLRQHRAYGRGSRTFRAVRREAGRPVGVSPAFYLGSLRHAGRGSPPLRGAALMLLTVAAHGAYLSGLAAGNPRRSRPNLRHEKA